MENRIVENAPAPREESTKRVEQKMLPQQIETHGISQKDMVKTKENIEAIRRITTSAETSNPGRVGE